MSMRAAVSFENELVRVVYASVGRDRVSIKKTLTLRDEEFDGFLEKEKIREFTVACDFDVFYQSILLLPPVKDKYINSIVEVEMKKKFQDLDDFSFYYTLLGEARPEGKKARETFIFAVNNEDIFRVIDRFGKYGKTVDCLYPSPYLLAHFAKMSGALPDDPVLCVGGTGTIKTLLLMKDRELHFVRVVQSSGAGMRAPDIQNINMTASYCRQTMKMNPSRIILLGAASQGYEPSMEMISPVECADGFSDTVTSAEDIAEYIAPVTALLPGGEIGKGSIVPPAYRTMLVRKSALTWCVIFFLFISACGLGYIGMRLLDIGLLKDGIGTLASEIRAMDPVRRAYEMRNAEMRELSPLFALAGSAASSPGARKALIALQSLHIENVDISSIEMSAGENALDIQLKGEITAQDYNSMQKAYQEMTDAMKRTAGMEIASRKMDLKDKSFHIQARYR